MIENFLQEKPYRFAKEKVIKHETNKIRFTCGINDSGVVTKRAIVYGTLLLGYQPDFCCPWDIYGVVKIVACVGKIVNEEFTCLLINQQVISATAHF